MPFYNFVVPGDYSASERLDVYVSNSIGGFNRSKLKTGVTDIMVNGKKAKLSQKIKPRDVIDIQWEDNIPDNIEPQNIPLEIVYEDKDVTVVSKAQGMVTHPACGNWEGTLVNALLYHWGRESIGDIKEGDKKEILQRRRPGIVHRLDKDTSGLIITAKNPEAEEWLHNQFTYHKILKEYICIVCGKPKENAGVIKTQIIRDPKNRKRFKAVTGTSEGKTAVSIYHVISTYGNYSLVRVRIKTGRTHQIRVHMKYLNCPILGDAIYNSPDKKFPEATLMLHSYRMKIRLPGQTEYSTFRTKTPERFLKAEKKLKAMYK